ncbi:cytochrome c3 family protein [Helicobacter himalayensis]|uniref:cytochrome c3 family protein n=1 Tax=Helicobacter himalayensis TaxID=1591088 RepID=UPI00082E823E|nr:cytochrome c3 family protein [Helicobacter himalayensis]
MKIFIVCLFFATGLFAKNIGFSDEVLSLFLGKDDSKVAGRLLPTNAFSVLESDGTRVKIKVDGFVNPKAPYVLYFNDSQRIIVAAFSKNTQLDFTQRVAGKNGKWDKVSIEVWTDKKEFAKNNKEMLARAKTLYAENCGICHTAHKTQEFTANQWPSTFRSMVDRTGIDKKDRWLVIEYLQKNAKDFKETK